MTRGFSFWCAAAALLSIFAQASTASEAAAQEAKRVVVQSFRGPSAGPVRNQVVLALKEQAEVELVAAGALDNLSGSALRDAAAEAQVSAIVQGKVSKKGKLLRVSISVRDADSGEVVHEEGWTKNKHQLNDIRDDFWNVMAAHILRTSAPEKKAAPPPVVATRPSPPLEDETAVEKPPQVEPEEHEEEVGEKQPAQASAGAAYHPALVLSFGPRLMWRRLRYDGSTSLNGYNSYASGDGTPAFNLALDALWFPGAHKRTDWLSDLGLDLSFDYSLGLKSKQQSGKELKTTAYEFSGGLLYRLPLETFEPRFRLGYVLHKFAVESPETTLLPGVTYGSIRLSLGTLVKIVDAFALDVAFGYLIVLSTGEFGKKAYASDLSAYGWEVGGGATYRIKEVFGLRLAADFRRYGLDMGKSKNATIELPKGGNDDYLRATLSFVYALPGAR